VSSASSEAVAPARAAAEAPRAAGPASPAGGVSSVSPAGAVSPAGSGCGRCGCSQSPAAARSACSTTAPSAAGSRALIVTDPSSATCTLTRRAARLASSSASDALRCAATNRSHCAAVIGPVTSASSASVAAVAIRVSARALAYDIRPAANSEQIAGRPASARATRTCSRAVPGATWHLHASHAAHEGRSQHAQPRRASNSATSCKNRQVPAARCPASSQIRSSSRSSGRSGSSGSPRPASPGLPGVGAGPAGLPGIRSSVSLNAHVSIMCSILASRSDIPGHRRRTSRSSARHTSG
jgi:hypothetical protein